MVVEGSSGGCMSMGRGWGQKLEPRAVGSWMVWAAGTVVAGIVAAGIEVVGAVVEVGVGKKC